MIPSIVVNEFEKVQTKFLYQGKSLHGVNPPEMGFGYFCFSHMIPPFRPEHMLILGYGTGVVAELTRKIHGDQIKITGVDLKAYDGPYVEYKVKVMDAYDYVKGNTKDTFVKNIPLVGNVKHDVTVIDLWNGDDVVDFMFDVDFVVRVREMTTKLLCMNIKDVDFKRCQAYNDYGWKFDRFVQCEANRIVWWSTVNK